MLKKLLTAALWILLALPASGALAQTDTVTGTVTDAETTAPLPGVNVVVQGTTTGTTTDGEGEYQLAVPQEADSLVFSFVGYERQAVAIAGRSVIDVELVPGVQELEDVVVTALGIERAERSLGYSTQQIDPEELSQTNAGNIVSALSGKIAGVQVNNASGSPGGGARIVIRGANSLNPSANNQPLLVVDGIPIDNSMRVRSASAALGAERFNFYGFSNRAVDINPNDIASIDVLKGAAATALYGVRAANGAIIITTKKGREGQIRATFISSAAADRVNRFPDVQQTYTQGFLGEYNPGSFWTSWGAPLEEARRQNPDLQLHNNWRRAYQTGYKIDNHLSLSGGSEKVSFYTSIEHLRHEGVMPFSNWGRTSIRLNGSLQPASNLNFSGSLNYVNSGGDRGSPFRFNVSNIYWTLSQDVTDYRKENGTMMGYYGTDDNAGTNPLYEARYRSFVDDVNRLIGNLSVNYAATDWMSLTYRIGMDYYGDFREQHIQGPQGIPGENVLSTYGEVGETRIFNRDITSTLNLTFSRRITDNLQSELILGNDIFIQNFNRVFAYGEDLAIPNFYHLSNARNLTNSQSIEKRRLIGAYGALNLNYDDTYYLGFTGRNDWSSTLPNDSRSFFYPSLSLSYVFTETFETLDFDALDFLDFGKLRASWAQVGKDAPPYVTGITFASPGAFPLNGQTGFTRSNVLGSPDLKPELTTSIEFGANLQFLDRRLSLDVSWYKSNSADQIIRVPISNATGYSRFVTNAGEIENRGIELTLNANVIRSPDFGWNLTTNFARNRSEVVSIREGIDAIIIGSMFGYFNSAYLQLIPGAPYGAILGSSYERYYENPQNEDPLYLDEDRPLLIGEDGFPIINRDLKIVGNMTPDWTGSLLNTFRYRNFELSALIDVSYGADKYNLYNNYFAGFGIAKYTLNRNETVVFEGVTADGSPNTQEVWLGQGVGPDERDYGAGFYRNTYYRSVANSVMDASYVKLRNISLTYGLPDALLQTLRLREANIGVAANNIILWTPYKYWDPEVTTSGASNAIGFSGLAHPGVTSYTLTLKLGV